MRLGRGKKYWDFCRYCGGLMAWRDTNETTSYSRTTGERVRSYWKTWVCTRCGRDLEHVTHVANEPLQDR